MRLENGIIALIVFSICIIATTAFIQENVREYSIDNNSMEMLQEAEVDITEFTGVTEDQKEEIFSDKGSSVDDTKESNLIWSGYSTIKKAFNSMKTNLKVTNVIANRSGIKGMSTYLYFAALILVILFLFFLAYYFRGYKPSNKD